MKSNSFCSLFLANNVLPQARPTKTTLEFSNDEMYDTENHPNPKLNKIWPIFKNLEKKFMDLYTPERDATIDNSPLPYKGRLGWVQYIPQKIARFGIKTYTLSESKSAYVFFTIIYTGNGTKLDEQYKDLPVSSLVVMTLFKPLLDKGHCVTVDNSYTSPQLADRRFSTIQMCTVQSR
jgi:hypothetical protein